MRRLLLLSVGIVLCACVVVETRTSVSGGAGFEETLSLELSGPGHLSLTNRGDGLVEVDFFAEGGGEPLRTVLEPGHSLNEDYGTRARAELRHPAAGAGFVRLKLTDGSDLGYRLTVDD